MLRHRGGTTIILPPIGFSEALGLHRVVLGSVLMAPVKAQLNATSGEHLEAVALVGF